MIDAEESQAFAKHISPEIEANMSVHTSASTPPDIGLGLFGYLESYRKLLG